jgi:hypothetical protein
MLAVSDLALIIFAATDESLAHDGMSPQRTNDISRTGSFGFWRMIGTFWVGAMLYRGFQLCSTGAASKYSSTTCFLRDRRYRPHTRKLLQIRVAFCISSAGRSDWPTVEHTCHHPYCSQGKKAVKLRLVTVKTTFRAISTAVVLNCELFTGALTHSATTTSSIESL